MCMYMYVRAALTIDVEIFPPARSIRKEPAIVALCSQHRRATFRSAARMEEGGVKDTTGRTRETHTFSRRSVAVGDSKVPLPGSRALGSSSSLGSKRLRLVDRRGFTMYTMRRIDPCIATVTAPTRVSDAEASA